MRRQRFFYTLPSQDDSSLAFESDNTSHYSYPDTYWSPIISPEPEAFIPCCVYPYAYFDIGSEQLSSVPGFYNPSLTPNSLTSLDTASHYNDELSEFANGSPNSDTLYGDGFIPESYSPYGESYISGETIAPPQTPHNFPMLTDYGAVALLLRHLIRVDISPAKAVYLTNPPGACAAAINGTGSKSCVIHLNGRVLNDGHEIHLSTLNRKAKICKRGVIFTSASHCLSYLVDASGTKTTAEKFRDLSKDFSLEIFYDDAMALNNVEECYNMINKAVYKNYWNGDEVWCIGGYRIKQNERGDVKVTRIGGKNVIRSSPTTGQISAKTHLAEICVNRYPNNYFTVKSGEKQVTASVKGFSVQNGTQKAGFNSVGKVALY